jgi:general nucleoside transport system ATP-binding protein
MTPAIELEGITKSYGAKAANQDVTVRVQAGTIHALVGENGAGKSTLLSIAYGTTRADAGRLRLKGQEVARERHSPSQSIALGVGMVHQHFMLVPNLSVVDNVVLGREPRRGGFLDTRDTVKELEALGAKLGLPLDPRRLVGSLSVGEQQRVEILKALWRGADVLLLDEPTAVLTPPEVGELFGVLRRLAGEGKTIVIVTHKLDEVTALCDHITVMRRGQVVADLERGATAHEIARAMMGSDAEPTPQAETDRDARVGDSVLTVENLHVGRALRGVSFGVRAGEVLGVAGVQGSGQSELILAIAGLVTPTAGRIHLGATDVTALSVRARQRLGLGHIPEDRHHRGLVLDFTLSENLILGRQEEFARGMTIDRARVASHTQKRLAELDVRPPDPEAIAGSLSGGNQQKIVVGRELTRPGLRFLVASEPTRGVDIGASLLIHRRLRAARDAGAAVLLVSSDLHELRALSDRLVVMFRGAIAAELPRDSGDDVLGGYMTGATA